MSDKLRRAHSLTIEISADTPEDLTNGNNIFDSVGESLPKWEASPFQLVSLLEMLRFHADNFVLLVGYLAQIEKSEDGPTDWESYVSSLSELTEICKHLGLNLSTRQISRLIGNANKQKSDYLRESIFELRTRIYDELASLLFLVFDGNKLDYYEAKMPFNENVFNKFPSATFDIEEAAKCFAMARFTASVMHLQRVLEIGLKSYAMLLGVMSLISTPQPSWHTVLDLTRKEIKERNDKSIPAKVWSCNKEKEFCEHVQPFLESVKVAWRNPSMHADKTYSEEVAEDIYGAIKRFMRNLAEHLDEAGAFTP